MRVPVFLNACASAAAVIHPAVPPPTMTTERMRRSDMIASTQIVRSNTQLRDAGAVARHGSSGIANRGAHAPKALAGHSEIDRCDARIAALRPKPLSQEHRHPARLPEGFIVVEHDAAAARKQLDLAFEQGRQARFAALAPKRLGARAEPIVEHEKIADPRVLVTHQPVVLGGFRRIERAIGKQGEELDDAALDRVAARRLQGLQESGGGADRNAVAVPELLAAARREMQLPRARQRRAFETPEQCRGRFIFTEVSTAVHIAIADALLQRNAPLPPGAARRRARARYQLRGTGARYGHRAIARQPRAP